MVPNSSILVIEGIKSCLRRIDQAQGRDRRMEIVLTRLMD